MKYFTSAIIAASGNSTRMGLGISKQLIKIKGKETIAHTLSAFEKSEVIDEIIVVCRECDKEQIRSIADGFPKVKAVVSGADTRAQSVINGVKACSENTQFFAIHDGARPLISEMDIKKVVERAYEKNAATLSTAVTDTIKVVKEDVIVSTPKRDTLRAVQTPQVFEKNLYLKAIDNAVKNNLCVTDDCSMVEALEVDVEVVLGSAENIKLTTQTDLVFAEAILSERK